VTEFSGGNAVDEYRRALLSAARDRVVAEAEDEVCAAWAAELAHVGHMTQLGVATARAACENARTLVWARQAVGDGRGLHDAQRQLEVAEEQARQSLAAADALLEIIGEEQELMSRAAEERLLMARAHRVRIRSAWEAVNGTFVAEFAPPEASLPSAPPEPDESEPDESQAPRTGRRRLRRAKGEGAPGSRRIGGTGNAP
jgi:hypothetical protein